MAVSQEDINAIVNAISTALSNGGGAGESKTSAPENTNSSAGGPEPTLQPSNSNPATDAGTADPNTMGGTDNETVPAGSAGSPNAGTTNPAPADGTTQTVPAETAAVGASGQTNTSVMPNQVSGMQEMKIVNIDQVAQMSTAEINANWPAVSDVINGLK